MLFRALPQYNGESRFTTWLYRLVVNLGRDELRRRGRQVPIALPAADDDSQDDLASVADDDRWSDPSLALDSRELRDNVRRALAQLDEHYRLVLTLYYFDDMKYSDIAEVLDIPLNTVKSHIRRGKERLAALLAGAGATAGGACDYTAEDRAATGARSASPISFMIAPFGAR